MTLNKIGRYTTISKIGSGGMAEIFLARALGAQGTEKMLVIKKVHPVLAQNLKFIGMFIDEARVAMRLNHTNIVHVYAFEQVEDTYILAMEYVDGSDLLHLEKLARHHSEKIPFGIAAYIIAEAAKGLDYAHTRTDDRGDPLEIVHRDVSPQNIMLSRDGAVKITDFGIAKAKWLHKGEGGVVKGKWGYMAPEQAGGRPVDQRADIYSLGVVLFELLVGQPFLRIEKGADPRETIKTADRPAPASLVKGLPASLNEVVVKATAVNPQNRYSTAREMARALSQYLHEEKELFDAQSVENWIAELLPKKQELSVLSTPDVPRGDAIPIGTFNQDQEQTMVARALGEIELRTIVLVSASVEIGNHPERDAIGNEFMGLVDEMAYKTEGILRSLDNGFQVAIGLPHSTTEDSIRALRLAHDIQDAARGMSRDRKVSINVKLAVGRGDVRIVQRGQDDVSAFQLDASLIEKSNQLILFSKPGDIVADEQTYKLLRRDYHFAPPVSHSKPATSPFAEINKTRELSYQVLHGKSRRERSLETSVGGAFYGRVTELLFLTTALREALKKNLSVVKITGETGIGKSRFVSKFLELQQPGSVFVLRAECLYVERDQPLASTAALFRSLLELDRESNEHLSSSSLEEFDGGNSPSETILQKQLEPFFSQTPQYLERQKLFLKDLLPSPESVWYDAPDGKRNLIRRAASGLGVHLELLSRIRPVVVIVENAHWLDGPSIDILSELAGRRPEVPILVLVVGQSGTLAGRQIHRLKSIELSELPDNVARLVVSDRLGESEGLASITDQIIARAKGNPFFANEIIDSLIEREILVENDGTTPAKYRQARTGSIRLPATVKVVAASRIDNLAIEARTVLRAASAVGAEFDAKIVGTIVGRDVSKELDLLIEHGLLVSMGTSSDSEPTYRFQHPLTREAAYDGLSPNDRQRIHRSLAAEAIDMLSKGESIPRLRIAWHLERGGDKEQAGHYYLKAGDGALSFFSSRQAVKLYDRAISLLAKDSSERFEVIARREQLLGELGYHQQRELDISELERLGKKIKDDTMIAKAYNRRAKLQFDLGDFAASARALAISLEAAGRTNNPAAQIEALRQLAYVAAEGGHLTRSLNCCERALGIIPAGSDTAYLRARVLGIKGFVLLNMGHLSASVPALAEALVLFRRLHKRRNESQALSNLALLAWARGELSEGREFLLRAMRMDTQIRDRSARGRKLASFGHFYTEIGDFDTAEANLLEAREICRENLERLGELESELALAELQIIRGEPQRARETLEMTGRMQMLSNSRLLVVRHRQLLARALYDLKAFHSARTVIDEAKKISLEAGLNAEVVHSGALQGLITAEIGLPGEAQNLSRRATDLLEDLGQVRKAERVWYYQALTLMKANNPLRAAHSLEMARREVARRRASIFDPQQQAMFDNHPLVADIKAGF